MIGSTAAVRIKDGALGHIDVINSLKADIGVDDLSRVEVRFPVDFPPKGG
jgi:hypothetical protein